MSQEEELFVNSGQSSGGVIADKRSRSLLGLIVTGVVGGSLVALYAVAAPFVAPALRKVCLPFVPATPAQVENVLKALRARSGTLVDIGSGDGRIVSDVVPFGISLIFITVVLVVCLFIKYVYKVGTSHSSFEPRNAFS